MLAGMATSGSFPVVGLADSDLSEQRQPCSTGTGKFVAASYLYGQAATAAAGTAVSDKICPMASAGEDIGNICHGIDPVAPTTPAPASPDRRYRGSCYGRALDMSRVCATLTKQLDLDSPEAELTAAANTSATTSAVSTLATKDWEDLPLDVWDLVWQDHLDLATQMALCLTHSKCALLPTSYSYGNRRCCIR